MHSFGHGIEKGVVGQGNGLVDRMESELSGAKSKEPCHFAHHTRSFSKLIVHEGDNRREHFEPGFLDRVHYLNNLC